MTLLLGIWTLSHLLVSSSSGLCGNQQPWANADEEPNEQTQDLEEPWLVSILGNGERCQGAVLNNWWVLTAASCFLLMKPSYVEMITTGGHFFTLTVSQFLSHRGFSSWARPPINDLGLVMLGQPIDLRKREMWPVCIPDGNSDFPLMGAHCRIHKRDQEGSEQWLDKTDVYILEMSECTAEWPGTADRWNICMARKTYNKTNCRVPVGSPMLCLDPESDHWELRGIVSEKSTNCSSPILASQVMPHLEWLRGERILKNPVPPTLEYPETTESSTFLMAREPSSGAVLQSWDMSQTQEVTVPQPATPPPEELFEPAETPLTTPTETLFTYPTEQLFETAETASLTTPMETPATSSTEQLFETAETNYLTTHVEMPDTSSTEQPFETAETNYLTTLVEMPDTSSTEQPFETAETNYLTTHVEMPDTSSTEQPFETAETNYLTTPVEMPATSSTEQPFETTSLTTPVATSQSTSVGLQLPVILPFTGQIFGVPPAAAKEKQWPSAIRTYTTVTPSTIKPAASTPKPVIFVAHPTNKQSSPETSTRTMSSVPSTVATSPVTSTTTNSPVGSKMATSPVTSTMTKSPVGSTLATSPVTSTITKPVTSTVATFPVTSTTTKSPVGSTMAASPVPSTTTKSPVGSTMAASPVTSTTNKSPVGSTVPTSPVIATTTKSSVGSTVATSPVTPTMTKLPVTSTQFSVTSTRTKLRAKSKRTKSPVKSKRTKTPVTSTTIKSPVTTVTTKLPVTLTRRESRPPASTLTPAEIIIRAHPTVTKALNSGWTSTPVTTGAYITNNKQAYVIPSKKQLSGKTRGPLTEKPTTPGQSSTSVRPASSVASPTTKQSPVTPTASPSTLAVLTVVHSHHVVIIPATKRTSLTSPASKKVSPAKNPSLKPPLQRSVASSLVATRPPFPKNRSQQNVTPRPPLALLTSPNTATTTTPLTQPHTPVTTGQCEVALAWNRVSQTYQLNKMVELASRKTGCGQRPGFVARCPGCSEAEPGEFPWVVSLTLSMQPFCAGSILNPWWILTTANCANLIKNSEALVLVQAGLVDISEGAGFVPVRQALTYPGALANKDLHNLGLLQLQRPLKFGHHVAPVCISDTAHVMEDFQNCWLPSWTVLQGGPARLMRRPLTVLSMSTCSPMEKTSVDIFCIQAQKGQEGICKGDLGSPLICLDPKGGNWVQLGVLSSFDEACSRPYIFNSLWRYLPWLEKATKDHGRQDNHTVPWKRPGSALRLRVQQEPEALVKHISARSALAWQVLIATCRNWSCGGSILGHYWVLTTAQCVQDMNPASVAVFVGLTHPKGDAQAIPVAGIYPYERIPQRNISNGGVALLLLRAPITFGKYVTAMALPQRDAWDSCKVVGLQTWKPGEAEPDPAAYQAKVLPAAVCARKHPGVNPAVYCVVRSNALHLPVATVGEGAALLCHSEAKATPWSQVGLTSEPFPGSRQDILSPSIAPYVEWMEKTSRGFGHHLLLSGGRTVWGRPGVLLLALALFEETRMG
ncbi:uncharacterized protein LOC143833580 [Paroedura picta]|uniref:uncharacterized protein LOC143833580 n=1 Tax=Paroedura picta TaxID=143630 RepID=UPI0040571EFA